MSLPRNKRGEKLASDSGNDMAKVEGLNLRGSRYYVRILIPDDLQKVYGKARVNLSLNTSDRKAATLLATLRRAEWLAGFDAKRSELNPSPVDAITPDMAALLAARVRAGALAGDDLLRDDIKTLADMARVRRQMSPLSIPEGPLSVSRVDDLSGATEEEREALAGLNAFLDGKAAVSLAGRNLAAVLPIVQAEAAKLGVSFDPKTPGAREALLLALNAYRTARREVTLRDAGEVVPTPKIEAPKTSRAKPPTLRDVYDRWKKSGDAPRSDDSIAVYDRALRQFEGQHKGITLDGITREMGDTYRTWLRENCNTSKTARDRLTNIKSARRQLFRALGVNYLERCSRA